MQSMESFGTNIRQRLHHHRHHGSRSRRRGR